MQKNRLFTKRVITVSIVLAALCVAGTFLLQPLLVFLAENLDMPDTDTPCDVMIVEGGPSFLEYSVQQALDVYRQGMADKIIFVLHAYDLKPSIFGIRNYDKLVAATLDSLGIPPHDYDIMLISTHDPYTYNTARIMADSLRDIASLLLFNDNFHIKRSFLTYRKLFQPRGVKVRTWSMDIYLNSHNWWRFANGWRRVINEYIKLTFYKIKGYI